MKMGLYLAKTVGSRAGFYIRGWTTAGLKIWGTRPKDKLLLTRARTDGPTVENTFK